MEKRSLGLIETWGFVPAVEAGDVGAKAADVVLLGYEVVPVGRVVVTFVGDVAAIKAAVQAGEAAAAKVGEVLATHVIPRPDRQIRVEPPSEPLFTDKKSDRQTPPEPEAPPSEKKAEELGPDSQADEKPQGNDAAQSEPQKEKTVKKRAKSPAKRKKEPEKADEHDEAIDEPGKDDADN